MPTSQTAQSSYQNFAAQMEQQYNIPTGLLQWQIGAESGYNPTAKNPNSSAYGIAQFTKATAADLNVNPADPYDSIMGAAYYMATLKNQTGSWMGALNAYGTTHDNPAKTAQAQTILNADNAGIKNIPYLGEAKTDSGNNQTTTDNSKGSPTWYDSIISGFSNVAIVGLFFIFGIALIILAFMTTDTGKKAASILVTKGAA